MSNRTGPFLLRDYEGEYLSSMTESSKATQNAIESLVNHQLDLRTLNALSTQILDELKLSSVEEQLNAQAKSGAPTPSDATTKPKTMANIDALPEDDPVRLLMEDYRRVCQKNEELVNMVQGLHQTNTDLSFFTQNVLNKLAAVAPSEVPTLPSSLSNALQAPATSNKSKTVSPKPQTFFVPSVFNEFLAPPADLTHDCEVCQEIVKLMTSLSSVIASDEDAKVTSEDVAALTSAKTKSPVKISTSTTQSAATQSETAAPSTTTSPMAAENLLAPIDSELKKSGEDEVKQLNEALRRVLARDSLISQIARDEKGTWKAASDKHLDQLSAALTKAALASTPVRVAQSHVQDNACGRASKVLIWTVAAALVAYMMAGKHMGPSADHHYT